MRENDQVSLSHRVSHDGFSPRAQRQAVALVTKRELKRYQLQLCKHVRDPADRDLKEVMHKKQRGGMGVKASYYCVF